MQLRDIVQVVVGIVIIVDCYNCETVTRAKMLDKVLNLNVCKLFGLVRLESAIIATARVDG